MKKETLNNILVKIIAILVIILICLVSFCGIYKRDLNTWKNILPKFVLSKELSQARNFEFTVDKSTKSVADEKQKTEENQEADEATTTEKAEDNIEQAATTTEGAEVLDSATETEENTTKEVPVNDSSALTKDNYKKSKEIIEKRLKDYNVTDFNIGVNENSGSISLSTPYTNNSDSIIKLITSPGKIEITDTDSGEVLIDKSMIAKAQPYYTQTNNESNDGTLYNLGIRLSFTSEGQKKFKEISKTHIETTDENGNAVQSTITVQIDGEDGHRYTTWFLPDENYTELPMTLYQNVSSKDMETFNSNYNECLIQAIIVNTSTMPIVYDLDSGSYIESNLNKDFIRTIIIIATIVLIVVLAINIIKNKKDGILISLIEIVYIAIHLLLIRLAGVSLTLSGMLTIMLMAIANYLLILSLYNQVKPIDKIKSFGKFIIVMIPFIITTICFTLIGKEINIQSIGMIGIWGILTFACTLVFSIILLNLQNVKKNGVENDEK